MFIDNTTPLGHNYIIASYGPGTVTELISPDDNPSGFIIRTLELNSSPTTAFAALYADTSAPSGPTDGSHRRVVAIGNGPPEPSNIYYPYPLQIASGWGLWITVTDGDTDGVSVNMTYDFISG